MSSAAYKSVYILQTDSAGKIVGTDAQQLTGDIPPNISEGDVQVSRELFYSIVRGMENNETFRYVGGDLIYDGPDLNTLRRVCVARIRKVASGVVSTYSITDRNGEYRTFAFSDSLLIRINLALSIHSTICIEDTDEGLAMFDTLFLRSMVKDYMERRNRVMLGAFAAIARIHKLNTADRINNHTANACEGMEAM